MNFKIPLTKEWLAGDNLYKEKACEQAVKEWKNKFPQGSTYQEAIDWLLEIKRYDWLNWFLTRNFNKKQNVKYAIYAASQVIDIYEKESPEDKRPRQAIEAAKAWLKNPTKRNRKAASAASEAARAASAAASEAASWAASWAASAARAARAASAASAARAASAASAARAELKLKICKYGIKVLKEMEEK
jgi:hypothetical protein